MNSLVQEYLAPTNDFQVKCRTNSEENHGFRYKLKPFSVGYEGKKSEKFGLDEWGESLREENDHSDALLKFISEMLMEEEDLGDKPCMLHDCLALQATEESLYNVLNNNNLQQTSSFTTTSCSGTSSDAVNRDQLSPVDTQFHPSSIASEREIIPSHDFPGRDAPTNSTEKKNRHREGSDLTEDHRNSKQLANNVDETDPLEMYDNVLLCSSRDRLMQTCDGADRSQAKKKSRPRGEGKKQANVNNFVVDLRSLLMQCAQAVANFDNRTANDLLLQIRQHSSPRGDYTERLAHYFAKALEARLAGTGTALYTAVHSRRISAATILKAYKTYITACPFKKMSNLLANKTIGELAAGATTLHVIDFGILYGYQWPCLIQGLSERPGGPPKLRLTGIDFPQPGFRPTERVLDTGRRLAKYCERFKVPFEYNAIAQKWETIRVEDLKIEKNELLVVNSLYRLDNVLDETVMVNSPRDVVLNLIKRINPEMFIQGIVSGTYSMPFFVTRFREALFHYSSLFDMFETTTPREDENRLLFEEQVFGKEVMNIVACEGTVRIERPETYRQWQVRNRRAGFRQLPLDQEIVKCVRRKVKMDYHKDFSVDLDGKWMLQGWKGRVINAISCWKPA